MRYLFAACFLTLLPILLLFAIVIGIFGPHLAWLIVLALVTLVLVIVASCFQFLTQTLKKLRIVFTSLASLSVVPFIVVGAIYDSTLCGGASLMLLFGILTLFGENMKYLQIVFCVLACLCAACSIVIGATLGWIWFIVLALAAALFAALMYYCKKRAVPPPPPAPDFMNSEEENEVRRAEREKWDEEHRS